MTQPSLDLGDIGLVLQGIGRCGCAQAMHAQVLNDDAGLLGIGLDHGIDPVGRDAGTGTGGGAAQRAKQRTGGRCTLIILFQVRVDALGGHGMQRQKADLTAFPVDPQVLDAASFLQILGVQLCRFFAAQAVVEQHRQHGPITQSLQRAFIRCLKQGLGLVITQRRRLAFIALNPRPFDPMHRVAAGDGIVFQEVIEEAGQRGQFSADGGPGQAALFQIGAPGQYVRPGDLAKIIGAGQPYKGREIRQVILIGTACAWVVQVGKPLDRGRYPGQTLEFDCREPALAVGSDFRHFLHVQPSIGLSAIKYHHFSHKNDASTQQRTRFGENPNKW
ncbi:hypothetical protein ALO69_200017 [Pseudomonas ficuserectae]|nr:hypothetical protein ALO69_200017 [Pseudomonas ficuserectae]